MIMPKPREAVAAKTVSLAKVLLVEGDTPQHFFEAFAKHLGLHEQIEIWDYRGITQLATFFKTLASTAEFKTNVRSVGIVRDAEDDAVAAMQSVQSAIVGAQLTEGVSVKVKILPDDARPGMIETMCLASVASQPVFGCINHFVDCLDKNNHDLQMGIRRAKHVAQIYLATTRHVQLFPGTAASRGVWPFTNPVFDDVRTFLQGL